MDIRPALMRMTLAGAVDGERRAPDGLTQRELPDKPRQFCFRPWSNPLDVETNDGFQVHDIKSSAPVGDSAALRANANPCVYP